MNNSRLIFIDGLSGSGKSTMTHFIARQMEKQNIPVRWYHEEEKDHQLFFKGFANPDLKPAERKELYLTEYHKQWAQFAESAKQFDGYTIVESYLFQSPLASLISTDTETEIIEQFWNELMDQVKELNPIIIYLYHKQVKGALQLNWQRRGKEWADWHIGRMAESRFSKSRNLDGETAIYLYYQNLQDVSLSLFEKYPREKQLINITDQNWDEYRIQMLDFLKIPFEKEIQLRPEDEKICGTYQVIIDEENKLSYRIYIENSRLCIDAFWPNLKLLPVIGNEYELEGYPFKISFPADENEKVHSMQISKDFFNQDKDWIFSKID